MIKDCVVCGAAFQTRPWGNFCGTACLNAQRRRVRPRASSPKKCVVCGDVFDGYIYVKTCGATCSTKLTKDNASRWRGRNREKVRATRRAYYEKNTEKVRKQSAERAKQNPEQRREYMRRWLEKYPDYSRQNGQRHYTLRLTKKAFIKIREAAKEHLNVT